ncbi:Histone-lysine N-methyltransferase SETMAR [Operophtera brumata]|uniref:Histone-lysine N-methyltransferase SETMAR n=1 Tax=Operophtera brumata TaxID=104452 RepID=A0A0L7K3T4_OPEBR|nr:Histone-lysine N-methyltransferase SETMAR [Operophtera brumata]
MNDNYSHSDNNLLYITESILGPKENTPEYEKLLDDYNTQYNGCYCKQGCPDSVCVCLQQSHGNNYDRITINGEDVFRICWKPNDNTYPMYECTSKCPCNPTCGNRVVQRGPIDGLTVRPCENKQKGLGLFTLHLIPNRAFICEYAGEIITKSQALARIQENESKKHDNYIFCLNEHTSTETTQTFVDPSQFGNIGRYINHSCDPNCCVVPVRCDTLIPKLAIFACKDIQPNEELTFRYGTDCEFNHSFITKLTAKNCLCNTDKCQGYLPFNDF